MNEIFLLKNGEMILKGKNRRMFEDVLIRNIKFRLEPFGNFSIRKSQSTTIVTPLDEDVDYDSIEIALHQIFGIISICRCVFANKNMDAIAEAANKIAQKSIDKIKTFKVEAKRSDKAFPLKSPEICRKIGGTVLNAFPQLKVDVHNPDLQITVEVRDQGVYVHAGNISAAGGMPVGTSGKSALMLSGGIDSPVAGYMIASRGSSLVAVHFESPPYTSKRAYLKVEKLARKMAAYSGRIKLYAVPFTRIQEEIKENCDDGYSTLIMRRLMCRVTEMIAKKEGCGALITGESLGQVASQTMEAIASTDNAATMPIFRPLIGMDKKDIIKIAKKIDTYETSVLPYEDCCTVFTPKHPRTRPAIQRVIAEESKLDVESLINEAFSKATYESINLL